MREDVSPGHLTELENTYYNSKVVVTRVETENLERDTQERNESELWMKERRNGSQHQDHAYRTCVFACICSPKLFYCS